MSVADDFYFLIVFGHLIFPVYSLFLSALDDEITDFPMAESPGYYNVWI